ATTQAVALAPAAPSAVTSLTGTLGGAVTSVTAALGGATPAPACQPLLGCLGR
ncbi:MAG: hypothetical protein JWL78_239, partial [Chloroflexi bacterium]|nr:hypothetical protein [Chloroflexota bacterium]